MVLSCENLRETVSGFSLVQQCDVVKSGALRIATPFHYPNGSNIDLFLEQNLDLFGGVILTDKGLTADYVADYNFNLWKSKKRRILIEDICSTLEVQQQSGRFQIYLQPDEIPQLSSAIVRLAQACLRATDLVFTQRLQMLGAFQDEVEDFIAVKNLDYESDVILPGAYGKEVKVDFHVTGVSVSSLVQTFSTRTNSHPLANEIFIRFWDLQAYRSHNQFITVYDDLSHFRDDDLRRLNEISPLVLGFPSESEQIYESLAS